MILKVGQKENKRIDWKKNMRRRKFKKYKSDEERGTKDALQIITSTLKEAFLFDPTGPKGITLKRAIITGKYGRMSCCHDYE